MDRAVGAGGVLRAPHEQRDSAEEESGVGVAVVSVQDVAPASFQLVLKFTAATGVTAWGAATTAG